MRGEGAHRVNSYICDWQCLKKWEDSMKSAQHIHELIITTSSWGDIKSTLILMRPRFCLLISFFLFFKKKFIFKRDTIHQKEEKKPPSNRLCGLVLWEVKFELISGTCRIKVGLLKRIFFPDLDKKKFRKRGMWLGDF